MKKGRTLASWCDNHLGLLFIIPAIIIMSFLVIYPLAFNIQLSLHKVNMVNYRNGNWKFVGLDNFVKVFTDKTIFMSLMRTVLFMIITVTGQVLLGFIIALGLNTEIKGKGVSTVLIMIPMMMTPVAVGLFWRMLLNHQWGIVNWILNCFGIESVAWLADSNMAFLSVCIVQIWWGISFVILILLGGLSSLPIEPFEAAEIDGANKWQSLIHITLPSMKSILSIVIMLRAIDAFREFDLIYTLTQGGPGEATKVLALQLYLTSFESQNYSMGATMAIILTLITMIFASGLVKNLSAGGDEND